MKERLTGAFILVALIVLLVPELLRGPVRVVPRAAAVSAGEEPPLRSYTINLADDARAHGTASGTSGPEPPVPVDSGAAAGAAPAVGASGPAAASAPDGAEATAPPAAHAAPATAAPAATAAAPATASANGAPGGAAAPAAHTASPGSGTAGGGAWMVQLGSFASRANAERLARQVRAGGFRVSVSQGSSGRRLYRVRVGPVHDREAAAQLASRLQATGHSGAVVPK